MPGPNNPGGASPLANPQGTVDVPQGGDDPNDWVAATQAQVDAAIGRVTDTSPQSYAGQLATLGSQLQAIANGTVQDPLGSQSQAIRARIDAIESARNNDRQLVATLGAQISQEKTRRLKEAHPTGAQPRTAEQNAADQAQADYYGAQALKIANEDKANRAKAAYDQALQAGMPPEEVVRRKRAADDAQQAADAADLAVKQAAAAWAPTTAAAAASTATSGATTAAAEAAHADEVVVAGINEAVARGNLGQAQAARILALLQGEKDYAAAQTRAEVATAAKTELDIEQARKGALGTLIDQLGAAVRAGTMTEPEADAQLRDFEQGSTPFERQKQREGALQHAADTALQYGIAVQPGQQYLPGGEPGGGYQSALGQLGVQYSPVQMHPQSLTQYVAGQGIQVAEQPAPSYFHATTGAQLLPVTAAGPNEPAPPGHEVAVPQQPFVQPGATTATPVAIPTAAQPVPASAPVTTTTVAPAQTPNTHWIPQAFGGTTYVPRALALGGSRLSVSKPPLFARPTAPGRGGRPRLFGPSAAMQQAARRRRPALFTRTAA